MGISLGNYTIRMRDKSAFKTNAVAAYGILMAFSFEFA